MRLDASGRSPLSKWLYSDPCQAANGSRAANELAAFPAVLTKTESPQNGRCSRAGKAFTGRSVAHGGRIGIPAIQLLSPGNGPARELRTRKRTRTGGRVKQCRRRSVSF